MECYRVLIADDQQMIRQILESAVENAAEFTLSGSVGSAAGAIAHCAANHVDLVLMDVVMGAVGG